MFPTSLFVAKYAPLFLLFFHLQLLWFSLLYSKFYQFMSANCSVQNRTQDFLFGACKISFEGFALSIFQKFLYFLQCPFPQQIYYLLTQPLPSPQSPWCPSLSCAGQQFNPIVSSLPQMEQTQLLKPLLLTCSRTKTTTVAFLGPLPFYSCTVVSKLHILWQVCSQRDEWRVAVIFLSLSITHWLYSWSQGVQECVPRPRAPGSPQVRRQDAPCPLLQLPPWGGSCCCLPCSFSTASSSLLPQGSVPGGGALPVPGGR